MLNRDLDDRLDGQNGLEKATLKLQNLFNQFVEQVGAGISITDEAGQIILWNPAMEQITGLSVDKALGSFIWDAQFSLLPLDLRTAATLEHLREKFTSYLSSGLPDSHNQGAELIFFQHGAVQFSKPGIVYAIPSAHGNCLLSVLYADEMRYPPHLALMASEEKFRNVVEQAGDGIIVLDEQETILEWNDGCEQLSGVDREHALGMYLTDLMPELFQGAEWAIARPGLTLHDQILRYLSLIARTSLPRRVEGYLHQSSGNRKWIQAVTFPIQTGSTLLFGVIAHDVTTLKQNEAWLQRYNHQLETLRQAGLEISAELGLDALVWMIAPRAVELLNGTAMALYLHNTEKDCLELALSLGDNQPRMEKVVQRGEGLAGRVWENGKPVLLEDFHTGQTADLSKSYWGKVAGAPLIWGNEFLGVVFVFF